MESTKADLVNVTESIDEMFGMSEYLVNLTGSPFVPNNNDLCYEVCIYPDFELTDELPLPTGIRSFADLDLNKVKAGFEKAYLKKIGERAVSIAEWKRLFG
jgi:hypothetical protein